MYDDEGALRRKQQSAAIAQITLHSYDIDLTMPRNRQRGQTVTTRVEQTALSARASSKNGHRIMLLLGSDVYLPI